MYQGCTLWRHRRFRLAIEVIGILVILLALRAWLYRDMAAGPVPELQGPLLNGEFYSITADSRRPLLVHFWASWCPVCKLEQQSIQSLSEAYPVITVAMKSGETSNITDYMRQEGLQFQVINDPDGVLAKRFGVGAVPSSFVITDNNQIAFRETGYTTGFGLQLRLWLARYWK